MSRLAKKPIIIPEKVTVSINGTAVTVKGPAGELSRVFSPLVSMTRADNTLLFAPSKEAPTSNMHVGTTVAHVRNMIQGSQEPFLKKLLIEGIGFKAEVKGKELVLALGFSHPVRVVIPDNLKVTVEKGVITVSGVNIETVGAFAARIRALKKPEPYKGKGIRYENEVVRRKQGKKTT